MESEAGKTNLHEKSPMNGNAPQSARPVFRRRKLSVVQKSNQKVPQEFIRGGSSNLVAGSRLGTASHKNIKLQSQLNKN